MKIVLPRAPTVPSASWARELTTSLQRALDALTRRQEELAQRLPAGVVVRYTGPQAPAGWEFCDEDGTQVDGPSGFIIKV